MWCPPSFTIPTYPQYIRARLDKLLNRLLHTRQNGAIVQTTPSNAFSWMKNVFQFKLHWILFPMIQLTALVQIMAWVEQAPSHIWTNDGLFCWPVYTPPSLDELKMLIHQREHFAAAIYLSGIYAVMILINDLFTHVLSSNYFYWWIYLLFTWKDNIHKKVLTIDLFRSNQYPLFLYRHSCRPRVLSDSCHVSPWIHIWYHMTAWMHKTASSGVYTKSWCKETGKRGAGFYGIPSRSGVLVLTSWSCYSLWCCWPAAG